MSLAVARLSAYRSAVSTARRLRSSVSRCHTCREQAQANRRSLRSLTRGKLGRPQPSLDACVSAASIGTGSSEASQSCSVKGCSSSRSIGGSLLKVGSLYGHHANAERPQEALQRPRQAAPEGGIVGGAG